MSIWKFEIHQSGKERVQTVGLRPFIVSFMLERGIGRGDAVNSEDGKSVSVCVECKDRRTALDFMRSLAGAIRGEAKSAYSNLPRKFRFSALEKENHNSCNVPLLSDKALATTLSQTSKGVGVMLSIDGKLDRLPERIAENTKCEMRSLRGEMRGMKHEMHGVRKELRAGFERLPDRIAKDTNQEMRAIRTELRSGFNRLPNRIAKAIRSSISAT